jgi:hypothetical protein
MSNWWSRRENRELELAKGVDADLIQANRKRYKLGFGLIVVALATTGLNAALAFPNALHKILGGFSVLAGLAGLAIVTWARQQEIFLNRPDSEEPPSILGK